jgi:hypothetical protein
MIAVLGIYLTAIALLMLVGLAAAALLRIAGVRLGLLHVLPLGTATAVVVLYGLGYLMALPVAGAVLVGLAVATLCVCAAADRRRTHPSGGRALRARVVKHIRTNRMESVLVAAGVVGGLLWLVPLFKLGFPTTIAATIGDGWSYVSMVHWLGDHSLRERPVVAVDHPLEIILSAQFHGGFTVGFEMLATAVASLLRRQAFEVVNAVSAVSLPIAIAGWGCLLKSIGRSALRSWPSLWVLVCGATPLLVLPFSENQAPHCLALALWPFAVAGAIEFASAPTIGRLLFAAVGSAGVLSVYTSLLPWLIAGLIGGVAVGTARRRSLRLTSLGSLSAWLGGTVTTLLALAAVVAVIAPAQVRQVFRFVANVSEDVGVQAPRLGFEDQALLFLGVRAQRPFTGPLPVSWSSLALAIVMAMVFAVCLWNLARARVRGGRGVLLVGGAIACVTAVVVLRFRVTDPFGYAAFKATVSGGTIIAGLAVLGLIIGFTRDSIRVAATVALAVSAVVWMPVSVELLEGTTAANGQGFRAPDIELGRALRDHVLGERVVLVEGAAGGADAFRLRMMASYFGEAYAGRAMEGLGTTPSYVASVGGGPEWRPGRPWSFVVTNQPQPVATNRSLVWQNGLYTLASAPALDVTTYGVGWYGSGHDDKGSYAWTAGPVELIVSNRTPTSRNATLGMDVSSHGVDRNVTVEDGNGRTLFAFDVRAGRAPFPVRVPLALAGRSTQVVKVVATPGPAPAARPLVLRFQAIAVTAAS